MKAILRLLILALAAVAFAAGWRSTSRPLRQAPTIRVSRARSRRWRRRFVLAMGAAGLVGGAALLSVSLWQIAASDGAGRALEAHPVIRSLPPGEVGGVYDRAPSTPTPPPATPAPTPIAYGSPGAPPPLRDSPYRIRISRIGVDAPVVTYGLDANYVPQVPYNAHEVAWYNFSSQPGTGGNAVFAGHVTWSGRAVFYSLDQLGPGDQVLLEATDGTKLSYTVREVFFVDPDDPNALSVMSATGSDTVTLITCGGQPFFVGGIARYDYTHRLVVRAGLTSVEAAGAAPGPAAGGQGS